MIRDIADGKSLPRGVILYGFCGGHFGRDSYDDKIVEEVGVDWVVARGEDGIPVFAHCDPAELVQYENQKG